MNGHVILLMLLLFLIGIQLRGQETSSDKKIQQKSTDIIIPPIEESIEMLTGSSIDNLSATIDLRAQDPSNGHAALKLYHSDGKSGVLFSDNDDNDRGFLMQGFGDPMNLRFSYGSHFFNSEISVPDIRIMNLFADGRVHFGPNAPSSAFVDIMTPLYSDFSEVFTVRRSNDVNTQLFSIRSDRIEQNVNHYLTGDLDITDGQVVVKNNGAVTWNSSALSFAVRVPFNLTGNLVQSGGTNTFLGDVNLFSASLNVDNEIAHFDNDGWQLHLNNDDGGADDANNWYIGSSHNGWNIGDDKLVFSKGTNSGSDWVMYLSRNNEVVVDQNSQFRNDITLRVNGSAYTTGLWVTPPNMAVRQMKSTSKNMLADLMDLEVSTYSKNRNQLHIVEHKHQQNKSSDVVEQRYTDYTEIIAITVGALQELLEQVAENQKLEERIARLELIIDQKQ